MTRVVLKIAAASSAPVPFAENVSWRQERIGFLGVGGSWLTLIGLGTTLAVLRQYLAEVLQNIDRPAPPEGALAVLEPYVERKRAAGIHHSVIKNVLIRIAVSKRTDGAQCTRLV